MDVPAVLQAEDHTGHECFFRDVRTVVQTTGRVLAMKIRVDFGGLLNGNIKHKAKHAVVFLEIRIVTHFFAVSARVIVADAAPKEFHNALDERLRQDFIVPEVPPGYQSAWAQYTIRPRHGTREEYTQKLAEKDVPSAIYYARPLHLQPAFADLGGRQGQFPIAEKCAQSVFSLPMHPYLTTEEADRVVEALLG